MRIYLAGKITKNGWRNTIVNNPEDSRDGKPDFISGDVNMQKIPEWPVREKAIFGTHSYTGPYFIGDDHGCAHGAHSHGLGIGHDWNPDLHNIPSRRQVTKLCIKAIIKSDLIFAWITENDCYGTIAEIGYAFGWGKSIHIAGKHLPDLWFLYNMSSYECDFKSADPKTALSNFLDKPTHKINRD